MTEPAERIAIHGGKIPRTPFCVGRRNWLFSDTPKGAKASALYYSLIETAKANGLEPYDYLRGILAKLPYADTVEKLEALLPWNFKKEM
jgi:hypothetical protein